MNFFQTLFKLPKIVWLVSIGSFISRLGVTMVFGFLVIYLNKVKQVPLIDCGWIVGIAYFSQALTGFFGGMLTDRVGRELVVRHSLLSYVITFALFFLVGKFVDNIFWLTICFIILNFIAGALRSWIETGSQAMISDIGTKENIYQAFSLRYTFLNLGVSMGPAIAGFLGIAGSDKTFVLAAITVFAYYLVWIRSKHTQKMREIKHQSTYTLAECLKILMRDRSLQLFVLSSFIVFIAYSQLESTFMYIIWENTHNLTWSGIIYSLNGIIVVALQMYLIEQVRNRNLATVFNGGILAIALGIIIFAFAGQHLYMYIIAMIIFTVGEIFSLSISSIITDQLAPKEYRGAYFGITNFMMLGSMLGSPLALTLYYYLGERQSMTLIALLALLSIPLFSYGWRLHLHKQQKSVIANVAA